MRITVDKALLSKAVAASCRIATAKTSLPVLQNVLMEADEGGGLKLTTSDLEMSIDTVLPARVDSPGATTLQAKRLSDILSSLPDEEAVTLAAEAEGMAELHCGKATYKLSTISADEFPRMKTESFGESFNVSSEIIGALIHRTLFAASSEEEDPVVNGCLLEIEGSDITMVSTDKRRLAIAKTIVEGQSVPSGRRIIHKKTIAELQKLTADSDEIAITFGSGQARFQCGSTTLISRLLSGEFPNYKAVNPQGYARSATADVKAFRDALKSTVPVARDNSYIITLETTDSGIALSSAASQVGSAQMNMDAAVTGEPGVVAFNVNYLLEALGVMDTQEVRFTFGQALQPMFFEIENFRYILMPVRTA